ncbi:zinc-binding dehydrogenase [Aquicoccus sp. SCR17]|nr:zinc-binding dehydrogenase [Carideicomes alvinocaridis]
MIAAQIMAPGRVEIVELPLPEPGPGEVRVRLEGCGVCSSNVTAWAGLGWSGPDWAGPYGTGWHRTRPDRADREATGPARTELTAGFPLPPGAPGREGWGRIDAIGAGVPTTRLDERVAVLTERGFASHVVVPQDAALDIPPNLLGQAVPAAPMGLVVSVFRAARIRRRSTVAVVGMGFVGAMLTRLASMAGARVIVVASRDESLELARTMGAAQTVLLAEDGTVQEQIAALTEGAGCDVSIECTGQRGPLDLAAAITCESGRLVIAGLPGQGDTALRTRPDLDIVDPHMRDRGTTLSAMREALLLVTSGVLVPQPLLTHRYPLFRLGDALNATRDKPDGFVKAMVVMP